MRIVMTVSMPVEKFNDAVRDGSAERKMARILEDTKPEAAYFYADDEGRRCGFLVIDLKDNSEIPRYAEPWFLNFNAAVKMHPTMTPQDLQRSDLGGLAKKWC